MKKLLLLLTIPVLLFSCSKEESMDSVEKETKTITPGVGYISPYDVSSVGDGTMQIKFYNKRPELLIGYRVAISSGYYDGNIDGKLNFSPSFTVLDSINAPSLTSNGQEFIIDAIADYILPIGGGSTTPLTRTLNSFDFNNYAGPFNTLEKNYLKRYGKVMYVFFYVATIWEPGVHFYTGFLKHDNPPSFTNINVLPTDMMANGYDVVPGVNGYNPSISGGVPMGIVAYHQTSREIIWPEMPGFKSEYTFPVPPPDPPAHLYFKTYPNHIEIVLE
jgi:hypothetical protein